MIARCIWLVLGSGGIMIIGCALCTVFKGESTSRTNNVKQGMDSVETVRLENASEVFLEIPKKAMPEIFRVLISLRHVRWIVGAENTVSPFDF